MIIKINIDEAKILELAKTTSVDQLPRQIYYQAKQEAINVAVNEIKAKLVERPYYSDAERLNAEVSKNLFSSIEGHIKDLIDKRLNENELKTIINRTFERRMTQWIEEKIYKKLEAIKKDIFIGSTGEMQAEEEARAENYE